MNREPYDYSASGFNGFLSRRIRRPDANTLTGLSNDTPRKEIDFDRVSTSGTLGDVIQVSGIKLDGPNKRIAIMDELDVEVGWVGKISD